MKGNKRGGLVIIKPRRAKVNQKLISGPRKTSRMNSMDSSMSGHEIQLRKPRRKTMFSPQSKAPPKVVQIASYKIGEFIGRGATGTVYKAMDQTRGFFFALKEIDFENVSNNEIKQKISEIQSEINIMKKLSHKNICSYYGAKKLGTKLHIFLEFISGGSLQHIVKQFGPLEEQVSAKYTKQLLKGLNYLHKYEVIHRDIKCANILVGVDSRVRLADFGCSRDISELKRLNSLIGTPNFMAPEVIKQTGHGKKADIWSVGCTVLEMLTGKAPFSEYKTAAAVMFQIASGNQPPQYPDYLKKETKDFLNKCFLRNPEERPTTDELLRHPFITGIRKGKIKNKKEKKSNEEESFYELKARKEIGKKMIQINELKRQRSIMNMKINVSADNLPLLSRTNSSKPRKIDINEFSMSNSMEEINENETNEVEKEEEDEFIPEELSDDENIRIDEDLHLDPLKFLEDERFNDEIEEEFAENDYHRDSFPEEATNKDFLKPQRSSSPKKRKIKTKKKGQKFEEEPKERKSNLHAVNSKYFNPVEEPSPTDGEKASPTNRTRKDQKHHKTPSLTSPSSFGSSKSFGRTKKKKKRRKRSLKKNKQKERSVSVKLLKI